METVNRHHSTIRQWKLLRLIYGSRYMTVSILAEKLSCSVKTVRRDLMSLEAAGFPVLVSSNPNDNYVRLERDWFLNAEPQQFRPIRELERSNAVHPSCGTVNGEAATSGSVENTHTRLARTRIYARHTFGCGRKMAGGSYCE